MKTVWIILLVSLIFASCNEVKDKEPQHISKTDTVEAIKKVDTTITDYGINPHPRIEDYCTLDTLNSQVINEKSFVLIYPTDDQLNKLKELNETDFYAWKEDNDYWMSELKEIAKQLEIQTITATKRKLTFISKSQKNIIDLDKKENGRLFSYNVILFTPEREPVFAEFIQPNEKFFNAYFDLKEIPSLHYQSFYHRFK